MNYIQISCLGTCGRFGNQLFQYAFARAYAEKHNCTLQTPEWVGQKIFNLTDEKITKKLPTLNCFKTPPTGQINVDLLGFFQNSECLSLMSRKWLKKIFKINWFWEEKYPKTDYYIAAHLRRGDYLKARNVFCNISEKSIYDACVEHNLDVSKLILVDESKAVKSPDLLNDMQFLPDFMKLKNSDILLRANSTFSWWAGTLGDGIVYSPIVEDKTGFHDVKYILGNHPKLLDNKNDGFATLHTDLILKNE